MYDVGRAPRHYEGECADADGQHVKLADGQLVAAILHAQGQAAVRAATGRECPQPPERLAAIE